MITFDDMLSFGKLSNGVLKMESGFSHSYTAQKTTGCILVRSLAYYTGEAAPKIQFALTAEGQKAPFYESHFYRIGKESEYTRQSWRVPPLFLNGTILPFTIAPTIESPTLL